MKKWLILWVVSPGFVYGQSELPALQGRYNEAVEQFQANEVRQAADAFQELSTSNNDEVAFRSRYNLGNCLFEEAIRSKKEEPSKAIAGFRRAIDAYQTALAINASDIDSRANIELALKQVQLLQDEQKQDEQQQDEQQQDEQQQDEQKQDEQKQGEPQEPSDDGSQDATKESTETESSDERSKPEDAPKDNPSDTESVDEEDVADPGNPQESESPRGELTTENPEMPDQDNTSKEAASIDRMGEITKDEANKMLQAIRDREMLRRLQKQYQQRRRYVPVEKDW